jgi:hypothetical protein
VKHDWPSVLDHDRDDVSTYLKHATNNLAAVVADLNGATCICCLQHPAVTLQTDTCDTSTILCALCGCGAVVPTSVIPDNTILAVWHVASFQTLLDYHTTEERCCELFVEFCGEWCAEHRQTLHDEVAAARYMRAREIARAADAAFAMRLRRQRCPSTSLGTCPALGVYDCDYCLDLYVDSHAPAASTVVCAGCDNTDGAWRCECTCTCGSPHGHRGLCAITLDATPADAVPPTDGADLATWRVVQMLEAWRSRCDT